MTAPAEVTRVAAAQQVVPQGLRSVILIAYDYPPSPEVGGLRANNLAKQWLDAGVAVNVVTATLPGESAGIRAQADGLTVYAVAPVEGPLNWWETRKQERTARRQVSSKPGRDSASPSVGPVSPSWKRLLLGLFWIPDPRLGFAWSVFRLGRRLLAGCEDSLIYSTAPTFSSHVAGLALARLTGLPWVMECRDPWSGMERKPVNARHPLTDWLDAKLERACLRAAHRVVVVSEGYRELLSQSPIPGLRDKLLLSRNGIPGLAAPRASIRGTPRVIVHAGTIYLGRDPRTFLKALSSVSRRFCLDKADVRVLFVGDCRWFNGISVAEMAEELGIGKIMELIDWLPHNEVQDLLQRADLLLLLAQRQPLCVPNKLYEYLGARRPILAVTDLDGESARVLREVGGHYVTAADDVAGQEDAIAQALGLGRLKAASVPVDEWVLQGLTTKAQLGALVHDLSDSVSVALRARHVK